jgi:hypothetical protein
MPTHPRLRVRRATPADARACQEIRYTAFRPGPMSRCLYPGDVSEAAMEQLTAKFRNEIESEGQDKSRVHVIVAELLPEDRASGEGVATDGGREAAIPAAGAEAVEAGGLAAAAKAEGAPGEPGKRNNPIPRPEILRNPETGGTIIAFAKWHLHRHERPESEWAEKRQATTELYGEGADLEACDAFLGGLREMRQQYIAGKPHYRESSNLGHSQTRLIAFQCSPSSLVPRITSDLAPPPLSYDGARAWQTKKGSSAGLRLRRRATKYTFAAAFATSPCSTST